MDDEIEDMVGDVMYTDSQKTLSSVIYSQDFADNSSRESEKYVSSGKHTYVIDRDSEDSDVAYPPRECVSENLVPLFDRSNYADTETTSPVPSLQCSSNHQIVTQCAGTSYHTLSVVAQETFTQTSKTIIELAETEGMVRRIVDSNNLQTQTSFMSVTESRTVQYRIQVSNVEDQLATGEFFKENIAETSRIEKPQVMCITDVTDCKSQKQLDNATAAVGDYLQTSMELEYESSNFPMSDTGETDRETDALKGKSISSIASVESMENMKHANNNDNNNNDNINDGLSEGDFELFSEESCNEDSEECLFDVDELLRENDDIEKLRERISEVDACLPNNFEETNVPEINVLTPLTEETLRRGPDSLQDLAAANIIQEETVQFNDELLFTNDTGLKVKLLKRENDNDSLKLPPIQNNSCPTSPQKALLHRKQRMIKAGPLPNLRNQERRNRWELATKTLASGESTLIRGRCDSPGRHTSKELKIQLPPINNLQNAISTNRSEPPRLRSKAPSFELTSEQQISIKEKIKELKTTTKQQWSYSQPSTHSRSRNLSPSSTASPDLSTIAHLGCEAICMELLRRLRSSSWQEVVATLEELPKALDRFWGNITEMRIADLLRQVNVHAESPRPQVVRTACATAAAILKNTKYIKKPDFYETVSLLLSKTGSYSRIVRRSANVALDNIVSAVDTTHALTALCVHGIDHKNGLVRCATARLIVVCCALAGAGRKLLRARPPTAATARRHTLRALSVVLEDKCTEARKFAERLYIMLRPRPNFEAYYLTDVDTETASRQMKKCDQMLTQMQKDAR